MNRGLKLWRWPLLLGVISLFGLGAALLGNDAWDFFSWMGLGVVTVLSASIARKL